jgi:hypothetical protein
MRVIRELATGHAQRDGLFLHASCFSVTGKGVIIAGPKRAGKTTLLLHALRHRLARYLANDRVCVDIDSTGPVLGGMPAIVTLRPQTLAFFPHFEQDLLAARFHFRRTLREAAAATDSPPGPESNGKYAITPAQLCALTDRAPVARARAEVLLFPKITQRPGHIKLQSIGPQEAKRRLSTSLLGLNHLQARSAVFTTNPSGQKHDPAVIESLCHQLAAAVRSYECELGMDAYAEGSSAEGLVEQLTA